VNDLEFVIASWLTAGVLAAGYAARCMNRRGWIAALTLGVLAAGGCACSRYHLGTTAVVGIPMPFAIFQLEEGGGRLRWIDYIGTPLAFPVNAACGFGGVLVVMSLATMLVPALRRQPRGIPANEPTTSVRFASPRA